MGSLPSSRSAIHFAALKRTPATTYHTRPKARPGEHDIEAEFRVRCDRVDKAAKSPSATTVNYTTSASADPHNGTAIVMLIHDLHIRIIHAATGEIIR